MDQSSQVLRPEEENRALRERVKELESEILYYENSTFIQSALNNLTYEIKLDRQKVLDLEFGKKIDESLGSLREIKNQAKRMADLIGLDSDMIRILVTEAAQNIIEHGYGTIVTVRFELDNQFENPCLISTFKNEMPPGHLYTMSEINQNSLKGDITSDYFDFENPRGRGEFLMKQLTDERRVVNGIEINQDGKKVNYFKRILINYRDPEGPRMKIRYHELRREIDRLDYEDVVCLFHVKHNMKRPDAITIAATRGHMPAVDEIMKAKGFEVESFEDYYRTRFATFVPAGDVIPDREELLSLFKNVRQVIHQEIEGK